LLRYLLTEKTRLFLLFLPQADGGVLLCLALQR
jgi:hypothetical protein